MKIIGICYYKPYNAIVRMREDRFDKNYFILDKLIQLDNLHVNQFLSIRDTKERFYEIIDNKKLVKLKEIEEIILLDDDNQL